MARLIYSMIMSLDGYVTDEDGRFDWAVPDKEVHSFVNDLERQVGTYLYGRRMYETMVVWDSPEMWAGQPAHIQDYAQIWRAAEKVVYSTTLEEASSAHTAIERRFDAEAVRQLKRHATRDISIGGPTLASHAIEAGLVDEYQMLVVPIAVGGGLPAFPAHRQVPLRLVHERRFDGGMVFVRYAAG